MRVLFAALHGFVAGLSLLACTPPPSPSSPPSPEASGAATVASPTNSASADPAAPPPSKQGPEGAQCGGIAGFGCGPDLYCDFALEAHCGAADQTGVCKPKPTICTEQYDPVCGCNDKTYANTCFASREGIAIAATGECAPTDPPPLTEGQLCGTRGVNASCGDGLYCKYDSDCGATDRGGTCVLRPQACTKIYQPVCGCDGRTYPSDCVAASQGVAFARTGACEK